MYFRMWNFDLRLRGVSSSYQNQAAFILIAMFFACELSSQNYFKYPASDALWNYKIAGS
jgi:hypothetical protein